MSLCRGEQCGSTCGLCECSSAVSGSLVLMEVGPTWASARLPDGMSEIQLRLQPASSWALSVLLDSVPMESSLELSPAAWWEQETGAGVRTGGQDHFMH